MFSEKSAEVRGLEIGGKAPVSVQTMYDSPIAGADVDGIVARIGREVEDQLVGDDRHDSIRKSDHHSTETCIHNFQNQFPIGDHIF